MPLYDDEDDDQLGEPEAPKRVAAPRIASEMPAVTARGLSSPSLPPQQTQQPASQPSPLQAKTSSDMSELGRLQSTGSGISQIKNPWARGALRGLNMIGSIAAPRIMSSIPGTEEHHQSLLGQQRGRIGQDIDMQAGQAKNALTEAQTGQATAQTGKTEAETRKINQPEPEKPENIQQLYADAVADAFGRGVDPNQDPKVQQLADSITNLQRQPTPKEPGRDDKAISIYAKPAAQRTPEELAYLKGYEQYVDKTKTQPGVVRMQVLANSRTVEVADPDHPGQTILVPASEAGQHHMTGKGSASVSVPRKVMEWATTGAGGQQATAFNTAMQHADLLEQAVTAMNNGDVRTLNSLKNRFQTEFGSSDVTNFQTIANAYGREITKMLTGGHMTDNEIQEQGATIPANASPEQLMEAVKAYRALAGSKMSILYGQYAAGLKGQPNFPASVTNQGQGPQTGTVEGGYRFKGGNPADKANWEPVTAQ